MAHDTDYFQNLCRVSRAFSTALKKKQLLELIVNIAVETMSAKAACLFLKGEDPDLFVPAAQKGLSDDYLHIAPEKAKDRIEDLVKNGYLAIPDATKDARAENRKVKKAEGIASILVVPVMVHDRPIGVLALYTAERRDFSEADIAFLTALADQGGIAVDRARLIEHIRKNTKLFYDLSAAINASLDIRQIMTTLTKDLSRAFGAKGVTVQLIDNEDLALKGVSSHGLREPLVKAVSGHKEKGVTEALKGKTTVAPTVRSDTGQADSGAYAKAGIATVISAPIRSGDAVIGVLRIYFGSPRDFYDDEIMMISAFADQAGLAIQNAARHVQVENDLKDLKDDLWSHRSWF